MDRVVVSRLGVYANNPEAVAFLPEDEVGHFGYLLNCFRRVHKEQRLLLGSKARPPP